MIEVTRERGGAVVTGISRWVGNGIAHLANVFCAVSERLEAVASWVYFERWRRP